MVLGLTNSLKNINLTNESAFELSKRASIAYWYYLSESTADPIPGIVLHASATLPLVYINN